MISVSRRNKYYTIFENEKEKLHNEDGPAVIHDNGYRAWYVEGELHRDNDLPAQIWISGRMKWWVRNEVHRDNEFPAIINPDGSKYWYLNNMLHRLYGPARIWPNGLQEWYLKNIQVTDEVLKWITGNNYPHWSIWDNQIKMHFALRFR